MSKEVETLRKLWEATKPQLGSLPAVVVVNDQKPMTVDELVGLINERLTQAGSDPRKQPGVRLGYATNLKFSAYPVRVFDALRKQTQIQHVELVVPD